MTDPRPKCSYWDTCYRSNPTHLAQFRHPADDAKAAGDDPVAAPKPKLKAIARAATIVAPKAPAKPAAAAAAKPKPAAEDVEMKDGTEDAHGKVGACANKLSTIATRSLQVELTVHPCPLFPSEAYAR
jgi:hypothetical protein